MHLARDLKHVIVHIPNRFLNGMGWVIDQKEKGMTYGWKCCEHENFFNLQRQKKSYKNEKYALFFEGVNFAYWSLGAIC